MIRLFIERWFNGWLRTATPSTEWFLTHVALPAAPIWARVIPTAELGTGVALILGIWPRVIAPLAFLMVLNFLFAGGALFRVQTLSIGNAFPVLGGLLALAIGARRLPWSVRP